MPDIPIVFVEIQLGEFRIRLLRQIKCCRVLRLIVNDLKNPPVRRIGNLIVVAFAGVGPVADVDAAVGAIFHHQAAEPRVVGEQKIRGMLGDIR